MTAFRTLPLVLLCACAGAPDPAMTGEPVSGLEQRVQRVEAAAERSQEFHRLLVSIDQGLESYVAALNNQGAMRANRQREQVESYLRKVVAGQRDGTNQRGEGAFDKLVAAAADSSSPRNQAIALAALGFADIEKRNEAMTAILDGVQSDDPLLIDRAVLGLAILRHPHTPPGVLMDVIDNQELPDRSRIQAAWALHEIQTVSPRTDEIVAYWKELLARPLTDLHEGVAAQAVRGVGLSRDPENASAVVKYASHPTPKVRQNAAIALGRMKNRNTAEALIALLGPAESNPNVRLAARKALQALAGGIDREYDVDAWRKVFDLGQ